MNQFLQKSPYNSGAECFTDHSPGIRWTQRAKVQGPGMLRKVGEPDWKKEGLASFRNELAPVGGLVSTL